MHKKYQEKVHKYKWNKLLNLSYKMILWINIKKEELKDKKVQKKYRKFITLSKKYLMFKLPYLIKIKLIKR